MIFMIKVKIYNKLTKRNKKIVKNNLTMIKNLKNQPKVNHV